MSAPDDRLKAVFDRVAELPDPADRAAFLDRECAGDAALRERVEALLRAHDAAGSFLAHPPVPIPDATASLAPRRDEPTSAWAGRPPEAGAVVGGRYKLLEEIGAGGMGAVWMAEQTEPVKRRVAVKLIKPGMDSRLVLARFDAERQALALMDHPNIAKVLDGGATSDGRPFFVMELVKGVPITKYCDDKRLLLPERLRLFADVCRAVQHAHQKGIIHRDIKPTNVLVAPYDGRPVVKVIDFGVAKATGQKLTEATLFTGFGAVVGTPEYMSPEQAELNNADIDTRSDVYALGVLLYELLTGTTPLTRARVKEAALMEVLRLVREEEPPRPSTRLSSTAELPSIAAVRGAEPARLSRQVRGELDWIVMKALEKDRNRRYETANGLAADVDRYLGGESVHAVPPSIRYRFRKFARRNRAALALGGVIASVLVLAVVALAVSNLVVTRERNDKTAALIDREEALEEKGRALDRAQAEEARANANAKRTGEARARAEENERLALARFYAAQMNLAGRAHDAGDPARVLELLETQRPRFDQDDPRGFEWYHLWHLCHRGMAARVPIDGQTYAATFSPDGRTLAVFHGQSVALCDPDTGRRRTTLPVPDRVSRYPAVAFAPDGSVLAVLTADRVRLFDPASGADRGVLDRNGMQGMAFFPDGRSLATSHADGTVAVWDLTTRTDRTIITGLTNPIALAVSPDGNTLALGGAPRLVALFRRDGAAWQELRVHQGLSHHVLSLAFSPDGTLLATSALAQGHDRRGLDVAQEPGAKLPGGEQRGVRVWDVATGKERVLLQGDGSGGWVGRVAFTPDAKRLVVANHRSVIEFDLATGRPEPAPHARPAHTSTVTALAVSADGKWLASGGRYDGVKVWDRTTPPDQPAAVAGQIHPMPDGRAVLHARATSVRLLDPVTGQKLRSWPVPAEAGENHVSAVSPDGRLYATLGGERVVRVREVASGRMLLQTPPYQVTVFDPAFSPDGRLLVVPGESNELIVWDTTTGKSRATIRVGHQSFKAAFSPDGRRIAVGSWVGAVRLFDTDDGRQVALLSSGSSWVVALAFTPDGRYLATANRDGTVKVWEPASRHLVQTLRGQGDAAAALAFLPDRRTLATGTADGVVRLWDLTTGQERATLTGHRSGVSTLGVDRDGHLLVSRSVDGTVRFYRTSRPPEATAPRTELNPDDPDSPVTWVDEGGALWAAGNAGDAAAVYARAADRLGRLAERFPDVPAYRRELARVGLNLSLLPNSGGRPDLAERARSLFRDLPPDDQRLVAWSLSRVGAGFVPLGRDTDAEAAFDLAAALRPDDPELWAARARAASEQGQHLKVVDAYSRLLAIAPADVRALNDRGVAYARLNQPEKALADFTRAAELAPTNPLYWSNRGLAHRKLARWEEAAADFAVQTRLDPKNAVAWSELGRAAYHLARWEAAAAAFQKAVELAPKDASVRANLGLCLARLGRHAEAATHNRAAIALDPKAAQFHLQLGNNLFAGQKWNEAADEYRAAIALDTTLAAAHRWLGVAVFLGGKTEESIPHFRTALRLEPDHPDNHTGLGDALRALERYDEAIASYREAARLDPKSALRQNRVGLVLLEAARPEEAARAFRAAIDIDAKSPGFRYNLGFALRRCGKPAEAEAEYRAALKLAPDHAPTIRAALGSLLDEQARGLVADPAVAADDAKRAVALAGEATELLPAVPTVWGTLGLAQYRAGEYKGAVTAIETAVKKRVLPAPADLFVLAMCHHRLGQPAEARRAFDQGVTRAARTNDADVQRLRREAEELLGIAPRIEVAPPPRPVGGRQP